MRELLSGGVGGTSFKCEDQEPKVAYVICLRSEDSLNLHLFICTGLEIIFIHHLLTVYNHPDPVLMLRIKQRNKKINPAFKVKQTINSK